MHDRRGVGGRWLPSPSAPRLLAWALAVLVTLDGSSARAQTRPNIVVIMADDLDVHSLDTMVRLGLMPAFKESFVDHGIRFTESFVTNSLCCPSRATFLTGQYAHNHGVLSNSEPLGGILHFKDGSTLATWLDDAGYHTGHVGKYLNGYGLSYMFETDLPFPQYSPTYRPPGWDDWQPLVDTTTYHVYDYVLNDNGTLRPHGHAPEDYQTDVLASRAATFLTRAPAPFFLAIMPLAPHVEIDERLQGRRWREMWQMSIRPAPRHEGTVPLPLLPALKPSFNETDVSDKPIWRPQLDGVDLRGRPGTGGGLIQQYRSRLESLRAVDDLVRRVFDTLRLTGRLANTVVLFTSDNGFLYGEHRLAEKVVAYEESIRVPLHARVPWSAGPRTVDLLVTNADLAPTIAALAGVTPGLAVDGRSLVPLLRGATPPDWRQRFVVEHWWSDSVFDVPSFAALRNGRGDGPYPSTLYVEYNDQNYEQARDGEADPVTFRELYDLVADPFQLDSLHRRPARKPSMDTLSQVLAGLRSCGGEAGQVRCQDLEQ